MSRKKKKFLQITKHVFLLLNPSYFESS